MRDEYGDGGDVRPLGSVVLDLFCAEAHPFAIATDVRPLLRDVEHGLGRVDRREAPAWMTQCEVVQLAPRAGSGDEYVDVARFAVELGREHA